MLVSRNSRLNFRKFQNSICLKLSRHTTLLSAGCRARYIEFQGSGWDFQFKIQTLSIMACTQMLFNFSLFSSFTPQNKRQKTWSTWSTQACSMTASQVHINVIFLYKLQLVSVAVSTSHDDKLFYSHDTGVMSHWHDDDRIITDNRVPKCAICTKRPCDIVLMKMKVTWFCLWKTISGSYLKQNNSHLVFQTRTIFLKWISS